MLLALVIALTLFMTAEPAQQKNTRSKSNPSPSKKPTSSQHRAKTPPSSIRGKKPSRKKQPRKPAGQRVPDAERTRQIEEKLIESGALDGTPDGVWDAKRMEESIRKYQQRKGLTATGKLDAKTLKSMGL